MKKTLQQNYGFFLTLIMAVALMMPGFAQDTLKISEVPTGQKMEIDGVILSRADDTLTVRGFSDAVYNVLLEPATQLKEKKSNPFRGAKKYSRSDLVPGLRVEVKGMGANTGAISAWEIRFRNDDHVVAQAMDVRVDPVENNLRQTQVRLSETEQNAQRLSGQVQELSSISNAARGGAKAAQETADTALSTANNANSTAERARAGVRVANERITQLDDYEMRDVVTVYFKAGSAALADNHKSELDSFAELTRTARGFVVEVAGFASSDGDTEFNRRLSQKRADAVIQYLAGNHAIPLRRFVTPMGYGEHLPVADNTTVTGRRENRRVEVRLLVSKGMTLPAESTAQNLQ